MMPSIRLKPHLIPIILALAATLIALAGSEVTTYLRYDRNLIMAGELWRVFTGHLVHLSGRHMLMNIAGLALVWVLVGRYMDAIAWTIFLLCNALFISLGLLWLDPQLSWYVGLSGILHGLLVAGCFSGIWCSAKDRPQLILLLVLISAKLAWEQITGPMPGSEATAGGRVIVDAHFYGAVCGLLWGVGLKIHQHRLSLAQ